MSNVYDHKTKKVLLAKFTASEQMKADNEGKITSTIADFWRTKTYVKPQDMMNTGYPIFPQPYQFAADLNGGTWNDYNECAVVQVGICNMHCWYCYVDPALRQGNPVTDEGVVVGDWFSPDEVKAMFEASGTKVWRISGGEPTLAPEFLVDMVNLCMWEDNVLWIDTNLCGDARFWEQTRKKVVPEFQKEVGVCGCFKGFTELDASSATKGGGGVLTTQFQNARSLILDTHYQPFFYVPDVITYHTSDGDIRTFMERMIEEVDPMAPLRTHIIQIKDYAATDKEHWSKWTQRLPSGKRPIQVWQDLLAEYYTPEQRWLPSHTVELRNRGI